MEWMVVAYMQRKVNITKLTILCYDLLWPITHISTKDWQLAAIPKTALYFLAKMSGRWLQIEWQEKKKGRIRPAFELGLTDSQGKTNEKPTNKCNQTFCLKIYFLRLFLLLFERLFLGTFQDRTGPLGRIRKAKS